MPAKTDALRDKVLRKIATGQSYQKVGKVTYRIGRKSVHIKVKTGNLRKYPFNINDAVLSADYEVLVCGSEDKYYVLPQALIKKMHEDPHAMEDSWHPGYTVYDIHPQQNSIVYGTGGASVDITKFRNTDIPQS